MLWRMLRAERSEMSEPDGYQLARLVLKNGHLAQLQHMLCIPEKHL